MYRNPLPKIIVLTIICANLLATAASQPKPPAEVDITKCWASPAPEGSGAGFVSDGSKLYAGGDGGRIEALSLDGKKMWATELGGDIRSNLLATDSGLFLVTTTISADTTKSPLNQIVSLSKETGITNWTGKLPDASGHSLNGYQGTVVIVSKNGVIQSIDSKTGAVKWKREIAEGFAAEPRFFAEKLIVASTAKQVFVISLATGEIESMRKVPFDVTAVGQTSAGDLVVGDDRGNLTSFLGSTEKVNWKFRSGGEISAILAVDDHILVSSHDNFAYSLVTRTGSVAWKRRLAGRVSHITAFGGLYALISGFEDHGTVLTDLSNGKVAGQIALGDETLTYDPIVSSGLIYVLTTGSVRAFSLKGCGEKKEGGPGK